MSRRYGIPIQGSKNKIAEWVVSALPPAEHLYDVFCGGGAITHCALMSGKWNCVHFSDISDTVTCVRGLLEGNIPDGSEWISREEFYRRKDSDPWVRLLWSFSNNQRDYLYSRKLEPYKKAVHEMIFAPTPTERRLKFREVCKLIPSVWGVERHLYDHESSERIQQITPPHTGRTLGKTSEAMWRLQSTEALPPPLSATYRLEPMERIGGGGTKDCSLRSEERSVNTRPFVVGSMNVA